MGAVRAGMHPTGRGYVGDRAAPGHDGGTPSVRRMVADARHGGQDYGAMLSSGGAESAQAPGSSMWRASGVTGCNCVGAVRKGQRLARGGR